MRSIGLSVSPLALALAFGSAATPAASETSQAQPATTVGELIITADKREQRLQDVPISVTAITGADLNARGATNFEQMQYAVPGLSAIEYGPGTGEQVQIRGISSSIGSPTVGIYVDELPITSIEAGVSFDFRMLDLDRIEVLRGPQGTLYGEGSMGGTIRYITASPDLERFSGNIEGEVNTVADGGVGYKVDGVLNLPLIKDVLGLRLVASDEKDAGWIDDSVTGQKDVNAAEIKTFRGKLLFEPRPGTKISLLWLHQESDQGQQNFGNNGVTSYAFPPYNNNKYDLLNGVLSQDLGFANLIESVGYVHNNTLTAFDVSPFYVPVIELFGFPPGFVTTVGLTGDDASNIFANEVRLSSKGGSPFNWTIGTFYRDESIDGVTETVTEPNTLPFQVLDGVTELRSKSWAAFGEANYQITSHLLATVGLRYFSDQRSEDADSVSFGFPTHDVNTGTFSTLNPRFNLRYEFSPTSMVYVNVAKGFRSGGFNLTSAGGGVFTVPPRYFPDSLWSYEAGTKHELFDRKLELQGAVYYEDWTNVQQDVFLPTSAIIIVQNAGHAAGWGTDLQADWHATPDLDLSATYGWNNLHFLTTTSEKAAGEPVDFAVHESASVSADFHHPIGEATGFVRLDYQYAGAGQINIDDFATHIHLPARDSLGLHVGVDYRQFEISVFGTNLTDNRTPIIPGPFGVLFENVEQTPRTIGVNLKAHF